MLQYLDEHGYAVVASVADAEEVEKAKSLMWDFLEGVPGTLVRRDDPSTWDKDWVPSETNGIIQGYGFAHSKFLWNIRLLPMVKRAFAAIWGTDDLIVSFDAGNAFRPWRRNLEWITAGGWYHVDQNSHLPGQSGKVCIQGLVSLCAANEETGGLTVIPHSHKQHEAMCARHPSAKGLGNFVPLEDTDPILEMQAILVCLQPGDLALWDSRTVHCNTPSLTAMNPEIDSSAVGLEKSGTDELIRQVGYVCMTPAKDATDEILEARCSAFINNISTNHWPCQAPSSKAKYPGIPLNDPTSIGEEQRGLVGFR